MTARLPSVFFILSIFSFLHSHAQDCNVFQNLMAARTNAFAGIAGEKFEQDGATIKLRSRIGGMGILDRSYLETATGVQPTYVAETVGQDKQEDAEAKALEVANALSRCLPGYALVKENSPASGAVWYIGKQGASQAPVMITAYYDVEKKWYTTQLKTAPFDFPVPQDVSVVRAFAAAPALSNTQAKDPCEVLRLFIGDAAHDFENVRADKKGTTTVPYPDAVSTVIEAPEQNDQNAKIRIVLTRPVKDPTALDDVIGGTQSVLAVCLNGWQREEVDNNIEAATYNNVNFTMGVRSVRLLLELQGMGEYVVVMEVR